MYCKKPKANFFCHLNNLSFFYLQLTENGFAMGWYSVFGPKQMPNDLLMMNIITKAQ